MKRQKPEVLTSNKILELSVNQSERKENVHTVLPDKQEAYLKDIYHRMPKEADQLIAQGFHNDDFDVVLWEICFARFVNFWMREFTSTKK